MSLLTVSGTERGLAFALLWHVTRELTRPLSVLLLTLTVATFASPARAHEVRPALLQISQVDAHHYDILWKQPANGEVAVHLRPQLSGGALEADPAISTVSASFVLKIWRSVSDEAQSLNGQRLSIEGLERTITDVLVSVSLADGRSFETILTPRRTSLQLDLITRPAPPVGEYVGLGIEHILTGNDHLLFVFGLLLLVGRSWALLKTVTAFTVAHSLTLAATALGWLHVRSSVIEALVALSIVILAVELVRRQQGDAGISARFPWLIAFLFGLLHGCAFAGALVEIGLPVEHVPLALFLFNVGVEIGQLVFIAAVLGAFWVATQLWRVAGVHYLAAVELPNRWLRPAVHYAIGVFASYWFIERFFFAIGLST